MIYINGRFLTQTMTGVQRYAIEIVKELDKRMNKNECVILCPNQELLNKIELNNIAIKPIGKFRGHLWEQISLPMFVKKKDVLLNLCNLGPVLKPGYVTIHDISFKTYPGHLRKSFVFLYRIVTRLNINRYKHIFTDSHFSKKEIQSNYGIDDDVISITYPSANHLNNVKKDNKILKKLGLEKEKFYFSLGSKSEHKNFKYIFELSKKYPNKLFVVTGNDKSNSFNDDKMIENDNLIYTGYLSDEEIASLYSNCNAFIFPSLYEGFGIPPLEAVQMGCKHLILSDIEVLKEIYGSNAVYVDTKNQLELPDNQLEADANKLLKKYSWSKSASTIYDIIHK